MNHRWNRRRSAVVVGVVAMAALAYIPAMRSSPGRMPADTKLALYVNPRQLVTDAVRTFDGRQFGGWVPHQMIAYLWPSGPWYSLAQAIGLPDWVAHRLWIGTIMLAAGLGMAWAARRLGLTLVAAFGAGLIYQLSPYIVPYISRTSSMLLPWAALGWIVGLTVGAATRSRWRDAALCALVIGTVGGVNATALVMIAPAPVLWLAVAAAEGTVRPKRAGQAALRIGILTLGTSAWWLAMLVIQGRLGADLLAYSESLEDVSLTATSVEVWRSLGYWLMYIRDPYAATTTAGRAYMVDGGPLVLGFLLVIVAVFGLAATRFPARRYAIVSTFVGLVLAVGVHRFADPSPAADLLSGDGQSGLALALRSSTRAIPLMTIGLALGAAALIDAIGRRRVSLRLVAAAAMGVMALGNLPVLTGNDLVDEALDRQQEPPGAWTDAASALDDRPDGFRVLQLPGTEFGAFTWGYTVDPPLPTLTDRPVVTRDLLPLGSPATMDLLYALDDRFQSGRPELEAIAPIARLLGADTIWLSGDVAFDRFRTPRPELTSALFASLSPDLGLDRPVAYGTPAVNAPTVPMVDEQALSDPLVGTPTPPVELVAVRDPVPIVRASSDVVVVSGSGDGLVDAAAAGLIDGREAILYSASLAGPELVEAANQATTLIVTDSNRRRARHWRGSQDVTGYTESGEDSAVLWEDSGDARLVLFPDADSATGPSTNTVSFSDGPVSAVASGYGERFLYRPEARPALAVDGDPNTAWTVVDATGQYIEITTEASVDHVTLLQPNGLEPVRHLESVVVTVDDRNPMVVELDARSLVAGQTMSFPATDGPSTIRIALGRVRTIERSLRPDRTAVGFAEVDVGLGNSPEVIRVPTDLTTAMSAADLDRPVSYVLTRERLRPTDRWRSDPEWRIVRAIEVPHDQDVAVEVSVRVDRRASDTTLAELLGIGGPVATWRLTGAPSAGGWAAADGDDETAWIAPFDRVVGSALNGSLVDPSEPITMRQRGGNYSVVTAVTLTQGDRSVAVPVPPPDDRGDSAIEVPAGFHSGPLRIEITDIAERTTRDRRYGDPALMPTAIVEVSNVESSKHPERFDTGCRDDLMTIDGAPVPVRVEGTVMAAFAGEELTATVCESGPVRLSAGEHRIVGQASRRSGLQVDRIVLDARGSAVVDAIVPPGRQHVEEPVATVTDSDRSSRTITVEQCEQGCWLIVGEGHHSAWSAGTTSGQSLGPPQLIAGGFNGWWIAPSDGPTTVFVSWTAQPPLNAALALSAAMVFAAIVIAIRDRPRRPASPPIDTGPISRWSILGPSDGFGRSAIAAMVWTAGAALFVAPVYGWWGLLGGVAVVVTRRIRLAGLFTVVGLVGIAVDVVTTVRSEDPPATPAFPGLFEHLHHLGLFLAVSLAVSALATSRSSRPPEPTTALG